MQIERHPTIFARLSDKPGFFACLTYELLPATASNEEWDAHLDKGPNYSAVESQDASHAELPMLTDDAARAVAEHSFFSGSDLAVTARVMAERGEEAAYDYCDKQNMYSMLGAPAIPEEELKWLGSGLTPTIEQGAAA